MLNLLLNVNLAIKYNISSSKLLNFNKELSNKEEVNTIKDRVNNIT